MIDKNYFKPINIKGYGILFDLENLLRSLILCELNDKDSNWWSEIKTRKFVTDIDNKISYYSDLKKDISSQKIYDEEYLGSDQLLIHKIYYTNMENLYDIISHFWEEHFKRIFIGKKARDQFRPQFKYITYLRNKVMHAKPITDKEYEQIEIFYKDINLYIEKSGLELIEFDRCIYLIDILKEFKKELNEHNNFLQGPYKTNELLTINLFNLNKKEWWWNTDQFPIFEDLDFYYKKIEELNNSINDPAVTKYMIIGKINDSNESIKNICSKILLDINNIINKE